MSSSRKALSLHLIGGGRRLLGGSLRLLGGSLHLAGSSAAQSVGRTNTTKWGASVDVELLSSRTMLKRLTKANHAFMTTGGDELVLPRNSTTCSGLRKIED